MGNTNRSERRKFGDLGEGIAEKYLKSKGFEILSRNYLKPYGEIDIVARKRETLHFVEVKTVSREIVTPESFDVSRETDEYVPEDNIHPWKIKRMLKTAQVYLMEHFGDQEVEWQCDAVAVYLDISRRRSIVRFIEHIT